MRMGRSLQRCAANSWLLQGQLRRKQRHQKLECSLLGTLGFRSSFQRVILWCLFAHYWGCAPPSSVASVVQGLLEFCGEFRKISFSQVRRQDNRSAHLLTKHAKSIVDFFILNQKRIFMSQNKLFRIMYFLLLVLNKVVGFHIKKKGEIFSIIKFDRKKTLFISFNHFLLNQLYYQVKYHPHH